MEIYSDINRTIDLENRIKTLESMVTTLQKQVEVLQRNWVNSQSALQEDRMHIPIGDSR